MSYIPNVHELTLETWGCVSQCPKVLQDGATPGEQNQVLRCLFSEQWPEDDFSSPQLLLRFPSSALEGRLVRMLSPCCSHVDTLLFHLRSSFQSSPPTCRGSGAFSSTQLERFFFFFFYLTDKERGQLGLVPEINGDAVNYTKLWARTKTGINYTSWFSLTIKSKAWDDLFQ